MRHVAVLPLALTMACGTPVVSFDVPISAEATFERGNVLEQLLEVFGFEDFANVDLESTREFDNNDVRREQVQSARLTSLNMSIVSPAGANFDWIDELSFFVEASGEAKARAASKTVQDGQAAFACDLDDLELAPYVRASSFAITTEANARRPPQDTTVKVDLQFRISATIL